MSSSTPLLPRFIDCTKLKYTEPKTLTSGAKSVYINYGSEKLTIQTPILSLPYGLGEPYVDKNNKNPIPNSNKTYDLTVSFRNMDDNPKIKMFHDKLKEIEQQVIDNAFENRQLWFKDDFDGNKAFCKKLFQPIIKVDKDPNTGKEANKYPPTFRAKLPYDNKNDKFSIDCYDMDSNEIVFTDIYKNLKGAKTQLIVQLTGIWFAGGKYGTSWKILSGKFGIWQNNKMKFIADSDNENSADDTDDEDIEPPSNIVKPNSEFNEDEGDEDDKDDEEKDDEDDEEEVLQEQQPPSPPPVPKKKAAVKKK